MAHKNDKQDVAIFSFFAGVGFLDLGFETTPGYDVVFVNDYIPAFVDAYKYSRKKMAIEPPKFGYGIDSVDDYNVGDKAQWLKEKVIEVKKSKKLVGFIAGPPCPDFSVGGKNRGSTGDHGRLSSIYLDIIEKSNPDFFLFENVKGLWRTKKHRQFFNQLKQRAHNAGYVTTERLVNAREYGVPQDRDRIILLGFKREILKPEFSSQPELASDAFPWLKNAKYNPEEIKQAKWATQNDFSIDSATERPKGVIEDLTVDYWFRKNNVENHLNGNDYFTPRAGLPRFMSIPEGDDKKKSYKRLHRWRYSPTCAYGNNEVHLHPYKARRISVAEALSLQSLPKEFILPPDATLSAKFKMIGNGVPYLLSKSIADSLIDFLHGQGAVNEPNR